jgi:hypothetical protein
MPTAFDRRKKNASDSERSDIEIEKGLLRRNLKFSEESVLNMFIFL